MGTVAALATERAFGRNGGESRPRRKVVAELSAMTNETLAMALRERGAKVNLHAVVEEIQEYGN